MTAADKHPSRKRTPGLPPPTMHERATAADAARALRRAFADRSTMGSEAACHIDFARPRCGVWFSTWSNLPGFTRSVDGGRLAYSHTLLPGWEYARSEIMAEMIPDLEALAERGVRPTEGTRQ